MVRLVAILLLLLSPALASGQVLFALAAAQEQPAEPDFEENFEGTPPTGWSGSWTFQDAPSSNGCVTTTDGGAPTGGGTYALQQWWETEHENSQTDNLLYYFSSNISAGQVFEISYWKKYDASFDFNDTFVKGLIARNDATPTPAQELYIDDFTDSGRLGVMFQEVDGVFRYSNLNGDDYEFPLGEWVHFRWRIKVSVEGSGTGYLYGWVNGTKRWEYDNIDTISAGEYDHFDLNSVFNAPVFGLNQKRWWDLITVAEDVE